MGKRCAFFALIFIMALPTLGGWSHHPRAETVDSPGSRNSQDTQDLRTKPIERELKGGEHHSYPLTLAAGQFLHAVVEQKGIDVVVAIIGPDGKQLFEIDSPNGDSGPEPVYLLTETAGNYQLEVRSLEKDAKAGRYEVKLVELRAATPKDSQRIVGAKLYLEALLLKAQQKKEAYQKAIEKGEEALTYWRKAEDREGEATTLSMLGETAFAISDFKQAKNYFTQELTLVKALNDQRAERRVLSNLGVMYDSVGDGKSALEAYNQALSLHRAAGDRLWISATLSNLGTIHQRLGDKQKALEMFNEALSLQREIGNREGEAYTLNYLGDLYFNVGDLSKAIDVYQQSLPLWHKMGNVRGEAGVFQSLGWMHHVSGDRQKALEYMMQSLQSYKILGNRISEGSALLNLGIFYDNFGEYQKALELLNQAIPIFREQNVRDREASALDIIGTVYAHLEDPQKALSYLEQALSLRHALGDRREEAYTLSNLGVVHGTLGEWQKALEYHNQALPLRRAMSDRRGEAYTLNNLSEASKSLGDLGKALEYAEQALPLMKAVGDRRGESVVLFTKAKIEDAQGNLVQARATVEAALKLLEALRASVASQELRTSFSASLHSHYEFYIRLLMKLHQQNPTAGLDAAAFEVSEKARARSLLELLRESHTDIRQGVDPQLLEREQTLQQQLTAKQRQLSRLLTSRHTDQQEIAAKSELDAVTEDVQRVQVEIRQKSPRYAALTQPQSVSVSEIQQSLLDADTLLLEYALSKKESYVWIVSRQGLKTYQLAGRAEIEAASRKVYELLTERVAVGADFAEGRINKQEQQTRIDKADAEYATAAVALSRLILEPMAGDLNKKRLLIVADGALQYVPFAALPLPKDEGSKVKDEKKKSESLHPSSFILHPLVEDHEIVSLPSASTLAALRRETQGRPPAPRLIALLADPVFDKTDTRVSATSPAEPAVKQPPLSENQLKILRHVSRGAGSETVTEVSVNIPRLANTRIEAEKILAFAKGRNPFKALDFQASRDTVLKTDLSQYRYVHFSTHGYLDSERPELSALIFSMVNEKGEPQDGFVRLQDVFNLNLPVEMVVLDACETGLGKEINGEGMVGLTRGFMYAGAKRLVVSLWSVNERASTDLMVKMYEKLLKENLSPAAALRQAQLELMKTERWKSPYFWSGFVLQGEYK